MAGDRNEKCPRAGNFKLHEKICLCCERTEDEKNRTFDHKNKKRVQNKTELYLSVTILCLCSHMQDVYGTVHWPDNPNCTKTPLWPSE